MADFIGDLLGDLLGWLLDSNKVPKVIRYTLTTVLYIGFAVLFIFLAIIGDTVGMRVLFGVLAIMFLVFYVFSIRKISRS